VPRRGSKNPPFLLARQEGKAPVDEKRPTPGDRKRQGISTDQVEKDGSHGQTISLGTSWGTKARNQCPTVAAETPHLCGHGNEERLMCTKNVRLPRAENARESARIRWKRVVSTAEAVSCRGSRNHPLLLPRQRGKAPVAENQCDARGRKRQGISTDMEKRMVSTPGNQCPAAAAEIAHFCCRGNERRLRWPQTGPTPTGRKR